MTFYCFQREKKLPKYLKNINLSYKIVVTRKTIMAVNFEFKERYNFDDLVRIVKVLREPGGCPWDMEQTHQSIRENFLEETYEVIEAIDTNNKDLMQEELGDVLLQVLMHSDMARTEGWFTIDDVANDICKNYRREGMFFDEILDEAKIGGK